MTKLHCPICDKLFDDNDERASLPFCSSRCKLIDAGRWFDEAYGLPIEPEEEEHKEPGGVSPRS